MAVCNAVNFAGVKCGFALDDEPYFIYHDGLGRITVLKYLCPNHSNELLGKLMEDELGYTRLIKALGKKIEYLKTQIRQEASTKNENRSKELKILYEKIKRINEIRNTERNAKCRFCGFPLKEPEKTEDQLGRKFSHATFHSPIGKRRADILFHTECGITWFTNKIYLEKKDLKYLAPMRFKQNTLFTV